jgi:hypothetical protein
MLQDLRNARDVLYGPFIAMLDSLQHDMVNLILAVMIYLPARLVKHKVLDGPHLAVNTMCFSPRSERSTSLGEAGKEYPSLVRNSSMRFSRSSSVGAFQIQSTTLVIVAALFDRVWL